MTESVEARGDAPIESSIPVGAVPLESILCTEELHRRPSRPPGHEEENRALVKLVSALADSPSTIFQTLAETILHVTQCDSAGLSLLTSDGQAPDVRGERFYWPAIAGMWNPHAGGGTPRNFGPCGDVLDHNRTLLFKHFERRYPYLLPVVPAAEECLLVPFYVAGRAVGTIWAIMHSDRRKFDAEDDRVMGSLGKFASSAYQALASIDELRFQVGERERAKAALHKLADGLEMQVRVRTQELECRTEELLATNKELEKEITERQRAEQALIGAQSRLKDLADEQAALRRVATLVARGTAPRDVFDAVCAETGRLIEATSVNLAHFTPDEMSLTMSGWSMHGNHVPAGTRLPLQGDTVHVMVHRTHRPARADSYQDATGELAALLRRLGIQSQVAAPVVVDGQVWGALIASLDRPEPLPDGTESRVANFAELIATAVSNAAARSELIESRARTVAAADAARQRVTRDLHDGAQQHFVDTVINLQLARQQWSSAPERAKELLDRALQEATVGIEDLRDLAAGIHPALLANHGLTAALDALAARLAIPVDVDVCDLRLPGPIEASVYFFCSEALTNVVKHAQARFALVRVAIEEDHLAIEVRDDGVGGVTRRPSGSGLPGLHDRIGALNGTLEVSSPTGGGTTLRASLPLPSE